MTGGADSRAGGPHEASQSGARAAPGSPLSTKLPNTPAEGRPTASPTHRATLRRPPNLPKALLAVFPAATVVNSAEGPGTQGEHHATPPYSDDYRDCYARQPARLRAASGIRQRTNRHTRNERKAVRVGCGRWRSYLNPTDASRPSLRRATHPVISLAAATPTPIMCRLRSGQINRQGIA